MLTYRKISDAAEEAYQTGRFFEFLTGRNGYDYPCPDTQVNIPTDWTRVIPGGIYNLYNRSHDPEIITDYENAIRKMMNGNVWDLWCAAYTLFCQHRMEELGESPFSIDQDICKEAKQRIENRRSDLEKEYPYGHNDYNMYEDILRLDRNFAKRWGYRLWGLREV